MLFRSHDQEEAQERHDDGVLHEHGAERDEHRPEQQRPDDAVEENAVLVLQRDVEVAEDQHEDEDVVDRQRLLHDVAGQELESDSRAGILAVRTPEPLARAAARLLDRIGVTTASERGVA